MEDKICYGLKLFVKLWIWALYYPLVDDTEKWVGGGPAAHIELFSDIWEKKDELTGHLVPIFLFWCYFSVRTRFTAFVGVLLLWNVASSRLAVDYYLDTIQTNKLEPDLNPAEDDGYSHFMTLKSEIGPHMKLMHMSCCFYHLTTSIMLEIRLRVEGWYHLLDQSMINQSEWRENLFI